jgi:hypothetical protein
MGKHGCYCLNEAAFASRNHREAIVKSHPTDGSKDTGSHLHMGLV